MTDIHEYFKIGIVHFMAFPETIGGEGPILETLEKLAADEFFELIEVGWIKSPEVRKKAREILETSHVEVGCGAQPRQLLLGLDLNSKDENKRKEAVQALKQAIDEAIEVGAKRLSLLSGKDPGPQERDSAKNLLVASLQELCDYASSLDTNFMIVLEIFDREVDKRCLIGPSKDAKEVAQKVGRRNFGLMHDLSHLPLLRETPLEALSEVRDFLVHAHIGNCCLNKNSVFYGDQHPRFGIKDGCNDVGEVAEFLSALKEIGYLNGGRKPLSIEVKPAKGESSQLVIANAKRTLLKAWYRCKL